MTDDGNKAVYTDSEQEQLGLVDITDASNPSPKGTIALGGEPTSVAVKGSYALVAVNTSADFVNTSGSVKVVHIASGSIVATIDLGGQPDSIVVSPDGAYAVVAIENERDEDLGEGGLPQLPAGFVVVLDVEDSDPLNWSSDVVDVTGLPGVLEPTDPEPEYVSINENNVALVALQENNAAVLIDLEMKSVIGSFSFGTQDLTFVDATRDDMIVMTENLTDVPREPDGVVRVVVVLWLRRLSYCNTYPIDGFDTLSRVGMDWRRLFRHGRRGRLAWWLPRFHGL